MSRIGVTSYVFAALLCVGCPGSGKDEGTAEDAGDKTTFSASSVPTYASFCKALTKVYCSTMQECCGREDIPFEREVCDRKGESTDGPPASCRLTSQPTSYDAKAAASCLTLRAQLAPDCRFRRLDDPLLLQAREVCDRVAVHQLPGPGEVCDGDGICSAPSEMVSTCDYIDDSDEPQTCSDPFTPAQLGERCAHIRFCQSPLFCDDTFTCSKLLVDGSVCIQDDECSSGSCSNEQHSTRHCDATRRVVREECLKYNDPPVVWSPDGGYLTWSDGGNR